MVHRQSGCSLALYGMQIEDRRGQTRPPLSKGHFGFRTGPGIVDVAGLNGLLPPKRRPGKRWGKDPLCPNIEDFQAQPGFRTDVFAGVDVVSPAADVSHLAWAWGLGGLGRGGKGICDMSAGWPCGAHGACASRSPTDASPFSSPSSPSPAPVPPEPCRCALLALVCVIGVVWAGPGPPV